MKGLGYVPGRVLESVGRVFDFGARKHAPLGWMTIPNYRAHFGAKITRHFTAYFILGERSDPDTGESHLAHLVADALMIIDRDMRALEREKDDTIERAV